jgi:hypothetical protein
MLIDNKKVRYISVRLGRIFHTCNIERNRAADFGVDAAEQAWLNGGAQTHVLFGKLRVFSFSDGTILWKSRICRSRIYYISMAKRPLKFSFLLLVY